MLIIGLTGSIATGKSTVSKILHEDCGLAIVDADLIAKQVVEKGQPAYNDIIAYFGPLTGDLVLPNGELNRPALGKCVFGEENKHHLRKLNSFTHPRVGRKILEQVAWAYFSGHSMVVLDVPLLFEAGFSYYCGTIINVTCDSETQLKRLLLRNPHLSKEDALKRIQSQLSMEEKSKYSDYVLVNNGTLEDLRNQVECVVAEIQPGIMKTVLELTPLGPILAALQYRRNCNKLKDFGKH